MKRLMSLLVTAAVFCGALCACAQTEERAEKTVYAMDTVMTLTAYGRDAAAALGEAEKKLYALDALLDRHDERSAAAALNRAETVENAELAALLARAEGMREETSGAFDATLAPVLAAWGFGTQAPRVPSEGELEELRQGVGIEPFYSASGDAVTLTGGVQVDLGGIAKGHALACVKEIFEQYGCTGVLDLGGDVAFVGEKSDGLPWRVAIKDPNNPSEFLGTLSVTDGYAIVTSGIYERNFTENGVLYHHIIDPKTLCPAQSGLVSVTVVCTDAVSADALSTALFVMGEDAAAQLQEKVFASALSSSEAPDMTPFSYILVTEDDRVVYSNTLAERFEPNKESGYSYEEAATARAK